MTSVASVLVAQRNRSNMHIFYSFAKSFLPSTDFVGVYFSFYLFCVSYLFCLVISNEKQQQQNKQTNEPTYHQNSAGLFQFLRDGAGPEDAVPKNHPSERGVAA